MASRKSFVAAAAASVSAFIAAPALGQTAASSPAPAPTPSAEPASKMSPAARALAQQMRTFDPALTDGDIETIAAGIDGNLQIGGVVNRHGTALKNWNEPVTRFEVQR